MRPYQIMKLGNYGFIILLVTSTKNIGFLSVSKSGKHFIGTIPNQINLLRHLTGQVCDQPGPFNPLILVD